MPRSVGHGSACDRRRGHAVGGRLVLVQVRVTAQHPVPLGKPDLHSATCGARHLRPARDWCIGGLGRV